MALATCFTFNPTIQFRQFVSEMVPLLIDIYPATGENLDALAAKLQLRVDNARGVAKEIAEAAIARAMARNT